MDRHIDELLNIAPKIDTIKDAKDMVKAVEQNLQTLFQPDNIDPRFDEDFETVRRVLLDLLLEVKNTVYRVSLIAADTEKAMDFQAMAQMSTVLLNTNKQILEIYEMKKKYQTKKEPKPTQQQQPSVQNVTAENVIFTGTTNDLKNFIQKMKAEKDGPVIDSEPST